MAVELATGYVTLIPSAKGILGNLQKELGAPVEAAAKESGDNAAKGFGDRFQNSSWLKKGAQAAGVIVAAAVAKGFLDSLNIEKANDKLAAQLGVSGKRAEELGKVAGNLYANAYGDSLETVNEAVRGVMQNGVVFEDVTNKQLESVTAKVLDVATAFDQDLGGTTAAVGQLIRNGLAKDADEALDIVTRGFQQGADKAGDLLDTYNEYGTLFRNVGLDAAAMTGILTQGLNAGARDADKVADAIKEFSIRAVDGSVATAEGFAMLGLSGEEMAAKIGAGGDVAAGALDLALDRLREMEDPVLRSQAAVALFGTQAEDLGDALFALDPSSAVAALGNVSGAAERMGDSLNNNAATTIESFRRKALQKLTDFIGGTLIPSISEVVGFLSSNKPALVAVLSAVAAGFGAWAVSAGGAAAATIAANAPIVALIGVAAALAAGIAYLWENNETFRSVVLAVWDAVKKAISAAWDAIRPVFSAIGSFVTGSLIPWFRDDLAPAVKAAWDAIVTAGKTAWESFIRPVMQAVIDFITSPLIPIFSTLLSAVKTAWDEILAAIKAAWNLIEPVIQAVIDFIESPLIPVFTTMFKAWQVAWDLVLAAIKDAWNLIEPVIQALIDFVHDPLIPAFELILSTARTVWDAISGVISTAWSAAKAVLDPIVTFAKETLAKVWDPFKAATDTIFGGISSTIGAALRVVGSIVSTFCGAVARVAEVVGLDNIAEALRSAASSAKTWGQSSGPTIPGTPGSAGAFLARGGLVPNPISDLGAFMTDGPLAIVGEGNPRFPEYVIPTDPKYKNRAASLWREAGAHFDMFASGGRLGTGEYNLDDIRIGPKDPILGVDLQAEILRVSRLVAAGALDAIWPAAGTSGTLGDIVGGSHNKVRRSAIDLIRGAAERKIEELSAPDLGPNPGWEAMWNAVKSAFPNARLFSAFRPNAITATGNRSYHGMGRAIDVTPSTEIGEWIRANYMAQTKEMIYSPMDGRQIRNGANHRYSEPTRGDHWDHVHWAMANGGVVDKPTLALLGESAASRPEIVTPEALMRRIVREESGMDVRVFIGDQELRGLVRSEVRDENGRVVSAKRAGRAPLGAR